jgi:uncharacterized protein YeaO (DUF488 family)
MPIAVKRIYDHPSPDDGHRLLVMRFWPRGVKKERVDAWDRGLAPSKELLGDLNSGAVERLEYRERFRWEMANRPDSIEALSALRERAATEKVTLLCWCPDEDRCHRGLLKEMIEVYPA